MDNGTITAAEMSPELSWQRKLLVNIGGLLVTAIKWLISLLFVSLLSGLFCTFAIVVPCYYLIGGRAGVVVGVIAIAAALTLLGTGITWCFVDSREYPGSQNIVFRLANKLAESLTIPARDKQIGKMRRRTQIENAKVRFVWSTFGFLTSSFLLGGIVTMGCRYEFRGRKESFFWSKTWLSTLIFGIKAAVIYGTVIAAGSWAKTNNWF